MCWAWERLAWLRDARVVSLRARAGTGASREGADAGVDGWGGAMLGWAWAGLGTAGWNTTVVLVPVQVCPCSHTELCAEMNCIPCLRVV